MRLDSVPLAFSRVFENQTYIILAMLLSSASFLAYASVPVLLVPGNTFQQFFAITPLYLLVFSAIISIIMGIVFAMQVYSYRSKIPIAGNAGAGLAGFLSGSLSVIFTTATCTSCVSAIFSFLGFAGVVFLIEHRLEISLLTFAIVLSSLYFTSVKVVGGCSSCLTSVSKVEVKSRENQKRKKG